MNKKMIEIFFREVGEQITNIERIIEKEEISSRDLKKLADEAHGLRGISASAGFDAINDKATSIEKKAVEAKESGEKTGLKEDVRILVEKIKEVLKETDEELYKEKVGGA